MYQFGEDPGPDLRVVNAYVQVGRAIAWVDPSYGPVAGHPDPMFGFNAVLTAVTSSLQQVFGD